jgi:hypothetical protein
MRGLGIEGADVAPHAPGRHGAFKKKLGLNVTSEKVAGSERVHQRLTVPVAMTDQGGQG